MTPDAPHGTLMNPHLERASVLIDLGRHELAERELRQALSAEPDNALARAFMALCARWDKARRREAERWAREAIALNPSLAYAHYVLAVVLIRRRRFRAARAALDEAIRLDPTSARYFWLLAAIQCDARRYRDALQAAEQGLRLDPVHDGCESLRALALEKLGRRAEADAAIAATLARNPENGYTHTAQGWKLLHAGDRKGARRHFREALRISPEDRWAEAGLRLVSVPPNVVPLAMFVVVFALLSSALPLLRSLGAVTADNEGGIKGLVMLFLLVVVYFGMFLMGRLTEARMRRD